MSPSRRSVGVPYRIVRRDGARDRVELHVLARAYQAAWLVLHARPPAGRHRIGRLGFAIDFGNDERAPSTDPPAG
jgi:hypothetical protein